MLSLMMSTRSCYLLLMCLVLSSCFGMGSRRPAPIAVHGTSNWAGSAGVHNVSRGDTLYSISNRYSLPMRDIAILNKLQPPFRLSEGQRLLLPPPQEYIVQHGDTLAKISRVFGVSQSQTARMNDLKSPYILKVGQALRLPSVANYNSAPKTVEGDKKQEEVIKPSEKPSVKVAKEKARPSSVNDEGVPVPGTKPQVTKVSKVRTKAPKRSSSKFLRPVNGRVVSNFGAKKSGLHNDGVNIAAPRGTAVKSAENGVVVYTGNALKGSGNLVLVRHDNQWMSAYAHLDSIAVKKGQILKRGASIGRVGSTGSVTTPQLHFELRRGTDAINPSRYMN